VTDELEQLHVYTHEASKFFVDNITQ